MGIEFKVAAAAARGDDDVVEVTFPEPIGVVKAKRLTTAQAEIMGTELRLRPTVTALKIAAISMGTEVADYLEALLLDGVIDQPDLIGGWGENDEGKNEEGLIDSLIRQFTGRPTGPSTGSSTSQTAGGRRSTARTPGKGSTRSASRSTGS